MPVVVDPDDPGEPCSDIGSQGDGLDSCAEGSFCFYVDPATKIGRCMSHCQGAPREPTCPPVTPPSCWGPDQVCYLDLLNNAMTLCYQQLCDPIAQNCPGDAKCVIEDIGEFAYLICLSDQEQPFATPCQQHAECGPGALCLAPEVAFECDPDAMGCCTPVCDAANPVPCPGAGQVCVPVEQTGPYHCENLGACRLPP